MRSIAVAVFSVLLALQGFRLRPALGCGPSGRHLLSGNGKFNYQRAGSDWAHKFPDCGGNLQSPININTTEIQTPFKDLTARIVTFGKGHHVKVHNTGQSVHVSWEEAEAPMVLLPVVDGKVSASIDPLDPNHDNSFKIPKEAASVQRFSFANVKLEQFHFHIGSENAINGVLYPMEAHLVATVPKEEVSACGDEGCTVVFAIMYTISEKDNDFLEPFFESSPDRAGEEFAEDFPEYFSVNFDDMIPDKQSYYTWQGSFTTPPCTEGVLWILFDKMSTVSARQLTLLESKMAAVRSTCQKHAQKENNMYLLEECNDIGDLKNNRELQPLNSRLVNHVVKLPATR